MKHLHQNQESRFNEVLFERRNKEYGAYVLRNESDRILTKALFVGVSLLAAVSITPFVINAFKSDAIMTGDGGVVITLKDPVIPDDVIVPPTVQPLPQSTAPRVKQYDTTVPTPSRTAPDTKKEDVPHDAIAGFKNDFKADPAPSNTYAPIQNTDNVIKGPVVPVKPEAPKEDPNKIVDNKDLGQEAVFVGGVDSFRNKVMSNFDSAGFASDDVMRTTITFIVEKDGTISGIKANGSNADFNNEAIRTIKYIKGKWAPAKNKQGESVRSYFKFPISMKFDN